jgi:hypothetical protein
MTTKNPTAWIPQPQGYGYVTTVASLNLETDTLLKLETDTLLPLLTSTTSTTGKYPATWSNTGS